MATKTDAVVIYTNTSKQLRKMTLWQHTAKVLSCFIFF